MNQTSILVADDQAHIRRLVQHSLKRGGFEHFSFATNGNETLQLARTTLPDIIILDFDMPGLDGLGALQELRADPLTRHIPVIMMSGHAEFHTCIDARGQGADQVMAKPFAPSHLLDTVRQTLACHSA